MPEETQPVLLIRRLIWDAYNVEHIANHHEVRPEEVEELRLGSPVIAQGYKGRVVLIGPTRSGRILAAILEPQGGGQYRPVTARPASRKERALYDQEKEGRGK